jgi:hypothetical protein
MPSFFIFFCNVERFIRRRAWAPCKCLFAKLGLVGAGISLHRTPEGRWFAARSVLPSVAYSMAFSFL